ncbi:Six-hairpin glycosidase-like protein [Rhodocollybia butyracea]|uniref:Six-hairpin glycosidase-like protein n=1 Tax=Rhodocollybia butyracea TaxID=206335 RepID=A0A9P5TX71_9AGAR|nr:Six-hairpin glycosidase-like protein [Rhodocollybia butyracea]
MLTPSIAFNVALFSFAVRAISTTSRGSDKVFPLDPGFDIRAVVELAVSLPSHSWEFGTASEALLELWNSSLSVFGPTPFEAASELFQDISVVNSIPSLSYARSNIVFGTGADVLSNGDGAVGDPASLGVSAVLLGISGNETLKAAAAREANYLLTEAPRFWNGAISQRVGYAELWADFVYMAPPFLAYYAVVNSDAKLLQQTVEQCGLYRQVLQKNVSSSTPYKGIWEHIIGPVNQDTGVWSTGNAWAAAGMTRVLATVLKAPSAITSGWKDSAVADLTQWIKEIVDGVIDGEHFTVASDGLLRNYLNDVSGDGHGYGETSGTALLASVVYRLVILQPDIFHDRTYIDWADGLRETLAEHITSNGTATPSVNPLNWADTVPYTAGSPEGQSFQVLLYSAWRSCVLAGVCES